MPPDCHAPLPLRSKRTMAISSKQEHCCKLINKSRSSVVVSYDLNISCIASTTRRSASSTSREMSHLRTSFKLDKLGVGALSSTPPSVCPGGNGFALNLPLTFSDEQAPILPSTRRPPASPVVAQRSAHSACLTHSKYCFTRLANQLPQGNEHGPAPPLAGGHQHRNCSAQEIGRASCRERVS